MMIKSYDNLKEILNAYNSVYIYGAGKMTRELLSRVSHSDFKSFKGILVTDKSTNPSNIMGLPVSQISDVKINADDFFIICSSFENCRDITEYLSKTYSVDIKRKTAELSFSRWVRKKLRFEVNLAEHCNLNCKGCNLFSPVAKPKFLDIAQYEKDINRLSELFNGEAERILLLGGEPLLNPQIEEIISMTRKKFREAPISIITNGVLLPQMADSFWKCCHNNKITIAPTKYPIKIRYDIAEKKAKIYDVNYEYFNNAQLVKTLDRDAYTCAPNEPMDWNFDHCTQANWCVALNDGKIFTCSHVAHIQNLIDHFSLNMKVTDEDGVDIYKVSSGEELMKKIAQPIPFCKHCRISERTTGHPYLQSERKREEWLDD